jgi:hypothetical protein
MKKIVLGLAMAAVASAGPAWADDKKQSKVKEESGSASMQKDGAEGRGGLSEWPVSKSPADWSSSAPGSASSGESTGNSGSSEKSGSPPR